MKENSLQIFKSKEFMYMDQSICIIHMYHIHSLCINPWRKIVLWQNAECDIGRQPQWEEVIRIEQRL